MIRRRLLATTFGAGLVLLGAQGAWAQNDSGASPSAAPPPTEELVITGSRIRHTEFTSPSPVQIVNTDVAREKGLSDTASILQQTTIAAGSVQLNNQFSQFVVDGGTGIESVSLRGLGAQRTLVLLNGRRLNPAGLGGTVGAVDLQVVPQAMVDRYEILKDGASSIYGSDAVGGVVNIITRDRYDGITFETEDNATQRGPGSSYDVALTWGRVRDNYHLLAGLEYYARSPIREGDLPGGNCPPELQHAPGQPGYTYGRVNPDGSPYCAFEQTDYVQTFLEGALYVYDPTKGAAFPFTHFVQDSFPKVPRHTNIATDPREQGEDAQAGVHRLTASLFGGVDLSPKTELYFELLGTHRDQNIHPFLPAFFPSTDDQIFSVSLNPFNPFNDYVQPVLTTPIPLFHDEVNTGRGVLGVRGDLPFIKPGWKFDTYATYAISNADYTNNTFIASRVANALDVVQVAPGTAFSRVNPVDGLTYTCRVNLTAPNTGCVPINWFEGSKAFATDPARAYITQPDRGYTNYRMIDYNVSANGPLLHLPAGDLQAAIGGEFTYDSIKDVPGPYARAHDYYGLSSAGITEGSDKTYAGFAELDGPLLKGLPFVQELRANVSARYTHQDIAGSDWTYKVGLNWQIIPSFRLRATYGTSFRGPQLYENFLAAQTSFTGALDPCQRYGVDNAPTSNRYKNCQSEGLAPTFPGYSSTPEVFTSGAQGRLHPETSKNLTAGFQWQPSFADLQVGVDYFHIRVNGEIARIGADNLLNLCYDSNDFRHGSPYCTLISPRDAQGSIATINDSYINIASQITEGYDVTLNYHKEFKWFRFGFEGQATYTTKDTQELIPGTGQISFNGTFGEPRLVFNTDTTLKHGHWTFLWSTQFLSKQQEYSQTGETEGGRYKLHQESQLYHTLAITYNGDKWKGTFGVRNIMDDYPPFISNSPYSLSYAPRVAIYANGSGNLNLYGRTFYVDLKKEF